MPGLFDTIEINGLKFKNRLVMPPMATKMATEDGGVTDRHIKHYTTRAKGGVGLVIIEHTYVSKDGQMSPGQLGLYDDKLITGFERLVKSIHNEGAKVVIQLTHAGAKASREITGKQPAGPSNIVPPKGTEEPRPLTIEEMETIIKSFCDAARRAMDAGSDSVELHGAHGFLLCQFLSPLTNKRTDEYGGDMVRRLRFPIEVIKEVKSRLRKNMPLFYRYPGDDMIEGGLTLENTKMIAPHLEQAGLDVFDVSAGLSGSGHERFTQQGYFVPLAEGVKQVVKGPVIGVGNITEPEYADRIVREGRVDMVAFGHMLLSNPEFPKQAAQKLGINS